MIRQLLGIRSWNDFQDFALTFPDPKVVWETFLDSLRNPGLNPANTALSFFTIIILLAIIAVFVAYFVLRFRENREIKKETQQFEEQYLEKHPEQEKVLKRARFYARTYILGLTFLGFFVLLLVANGVTGSRLVCKACHSSDNHVNAEKTAVHGDMRCVSCHEPGGFVSGTVLSLGPRLAHITAGIGGNPKDTIEDEVLGLDEVDVVVTTDIPADWNIDASAARGTYGTVNSAACSRCHSEEVAKGVLLNESTGIRVRHQDFLEERSRCLSCHGIHQDSGLIVMHAGMSNCITCHNGQEASADCGVCHTKDIGAAAASQRMKGVRPQLVQDIDCYSCHKPAGCDSCHGIRLPHSKEFMTTGLHAYEGAKSLWSGSGGRCVQCHNEERRSCNTPGCHNELPYHNKIAPGFRIHHADGMWETQSGSGMSCGDCHSGLIKNKNQSVCDACHSGKGAQ